MGRLFLNRGRVENEIQVETIVTRNYKRDENIKKG